MLYRTCKRMIISIHALREEGDLTSAGFRRPTYNISIHALREEGDVTRHTNAAWPIYFYPRPPRGGRQAYTVEEAKAIVISIHALREEGDSKNRDKISIFKQIIQHSARI